VSFRLQRVDRPGCIRRYLLQEVSGGSSSDHRKPNGRYVITPETGPAFVEALPIGKFHSIGPATSGKMNWLGRYTGLDMRNQQLEVQAVPFRQGRRALLFDFERR
jgi:nucleotidyltransferase/DNA polymerase involved in DNA repair